MVIGNPWISVFLRLCVFMAVIFPKPPILSPKWPVWVASSGVWKVALALAWIYISIKLFWFMSKYSLFLSWIQVLFTCKLLVSVPKSFHWKMERINKLFHPSDHETESNWFIYESSSMTNLCIVRFVGDTCKWQHTGDWKQTLTKKSSVLCEYCCILKHFNL